MLVTDIIQSSVKPPLYADGSAFMWTDEYISKQLLDLHLNPDIDLASRKGDTINKTIEWILKYLKPNKKNRILDLGCGPGLYTEKLASLGHSLVGVDISSTSIEYASRSALDKELDIDYFNENYLNLELEADQFDLIIMVYTDFGVLKPWEQTKLLTLVSKALNKGGVFIFDVLKDSHLEEKLVSPSWQAAHTGFWKNSLYLALSESHMYDKERVILYQHLIADEDSNIETYRFWTHFYTEEKITGLLRSNGFSEVDIRDDVLPSGDIWNGRNVLFCIALK